MATSSTRTGRTRREPLDRRIAGAPISWGVCEVPGWGYQMEPSRVLSEMQALGLAATEFGPDGFLPDDPMEKCELLSAHSLRAVGGFVPLVLHDRSLDPHDDVERALKGFAAAGAGVLVVAAATGLEGYDQRPELGQDDWTVVLQNLDRVVRQAADVGVTATLHPHVGTVVESQEEVWRVIEGSNVPLCLDTGHLLIGGTDPADLARQVSDRIAHTHLKDVDASWARRVRSREVAYTDAVRQGMYRRLGAGDVDIAGIVAVLESSGYQGWYVMEQDTILTSAPDDEGPVVDVRAGVEFLRGLG